MKQLLSNPVLVKEIKVALSFLKKFYRYSVLFNCNVSFLSLDLSMLTTSFTGTGYFRPEESFFMFAMLTYIQLGLILFITPGLTAGAISTEREKQTLNILLTTSQTSFQIIIGKLTSSIAFLLLLLVAGLPIYSMVFLIRWGFTRPIRRYFFVFLFNDACSWRNWHHVFNNYSKNNCLNDCYIWNNDFLSWSYWFYLFGYYRDEYDGWSRSSQHPHPSGIFLLV